MKANNKTHMTSDSVDTYINAIANTDRQRDAINLLKLIQDATQSEPKMWGTSIIGFGTHHYVYDTGREGDIAAVGFAARKQALAVYGLNTANNPPLLEKLGIKNDGKGCVYLNNIERLDQSVLKQAVVNSYKERHNTV